MRSSTQKQGQAHFNDCALIKRASPILKWAGGKTQLLSTFDQFIPPDINRYHEPFVGGGAMFFNMVSRIPHLTATLSDLNEELINCYASVRTDVDAVIFALQKHRNERDYFYKIRAQETSKLTDVQRAARLIYLNKTCFNGLYRVNKQGKFNVPFGSYKNPRTCDDDNLRAVSAALQKVTLRHDPFNRTLKGARKGDFVYLDPPYQPLSTTSNFTSYTSKCFTEKDQEELSATVRQLDKKGCRFMLSNSDNDLIRTLYRGFRIEEVFATRAINCRGDKRGKITELLIMNY